MKKVTSSLKWKAAISNYKLGLLTLRDPKFFINILGMTLESKVVNGFERLSEVLKSLLWEKAKVHGISPIQIQILLFVSNHDQNICNVSYLAKEFNVTKATISDAVRVLLKKQLLEKDFSPNDNRRYNLLITDQGSQMVYDLSEYSLPIANSLTNFNQTELKSLFKTISKLIFQLNKIGVIQVQRTCYNCQHYKGDRKSQHFCNLLNEKLKTHDLRLDCNEFEEKANRR